MCRRACMPRRDRDGKSVVSRQGCGACNVKRISRIVGRRGFRSLAQPDGRVRPWCMAPEEKKTINGNCEGCTRGCVSGTPQVRTPTRTHTHTEMIHLCAAALLRTRITLVFRSSVSSRYAAGGGPVGLQHVPPRERESRFES